MFLLCETFLLMYNLLVLINMERGKLMLSERLKIARKMNKLTQEELAKKVKATKGTISNYENEHSSPSPEMLNDLADVLDVSTDFLLGRTNKPDRSAVQSNNSNNDDNYDPMSEINKMIKEFGIEGFGFFDIEKWKHFKREDVEDLRKHFEWVAHKAKERNEEK
jgi:HTH-type transcriptional regulator, competence development regulator